MKDIERTLSEGEAVRSDWWGGGTAAAAVEVVGFHVSTTEIVLKASETCINCTLDDVTSPFNVAFLMKLALGQDESLPSLVPLHALAST